MNALLLSLVLAAAALPNYSGFVNDFAGALSPETKQRLESICTDLRSTHGAEMAVMTVDTTSPLDSKTYAVELFKKWGIGQKGKDNGVLLLLAVKDRRVEIEVGYGLEGLLPDARCGRILDDNGVPHFKQGQWGKGLLATAEALAEVIRTGKPEPRSSSRDAAQPGAWLVWLFVLAVFGLIGGTIWYSKRCPRCGKHSLVVTHTVVARPTRFTQGRERIVSHCDNCGYERVALVAMAVAAAMSSGGSYGSSGWGGGGGGSDFGSFGGGSSGGGGAGRGF